MTKLILTICALLIIALPLNTQQSDFSKLTGTYLGQKPPVMTLGTFRPISFTQVGTQLSMYIPNETDVMAHHPSSSWEMPSRFDWREKGIMTPVKHQMNLGSCGVFAAVAVFESLIKKVTGKTVDLSEQQIINCSPDFESSGISSVDAMKYIKQHGLVVEERLPYHDKKEDKMPDGPPDYRLTDYRYVYTNKLALPDKIRTIKEAVLEYGPVAKNMIFFKDLDQHKQGIYIYDGKSEEQGGHWIAIVGWQEAPEVKNGGYWICRNSWGERWGEKGYFNIAYGECGIDDFWFVYGILQL